MSHPTSAATGTLRAGVARSEITADAKASRVRDRLYAKALVMEDGKTKIVMVTMDVTAIGGRHISRGILGDVGEDFLPKLRSRIERELKIPGGNVLVNASHTHPPGRLLCDDRQQVERTLDAVRRAVRKMTPVRVGAGSGHEDRISINRNLTLKNGQHWSIRHANPSPPAAEVAAAGPIDPEIGLLRIDRLDGRPLAAVYNFACHPLFGDTQGRITANFPGVASRVIEKGLGHGAMALFLQGTAGDIVDIHFKDFTRPRDIESLGTRLGLSALKALRRIRSAPATLAVISETLKLPRRTDIPCRIAALQEEQASLLESLRTTALNFEAFLPLYRRNTSRSLPSGKPVRVRRDATEEWKRRLVDKYLKNLRAMERLVVIQEDLATYRKHQALNKESGSKTISAEIQGLRIGKAVLITSPLEVLVEVGLNIKRASPHPFTFVAAFSNGYLHYGPPASAYDKGGYEVAECLLAPSWQRIFEAKAREILRRL